MSTSVDINPVINGVFSTPVSSVPSVIASVTVDFDKSVFLQMALFALAIVLLKPILFDPMLRVFALREERTDGAKAEARAMQERAADILSNYEAQVAKVRADATSERDQLRKETSHLESKILDEARVVAEKISADGQVRIQAELKTLQAELDQRGRGLANEIANSILGRKSA